MNRLFWKEFAGMLCGKRMLSSLVAVLLLCGVTLGSAGIAKLKDTRQMGVASTDTGESEQTVATTAAKSETYRVAVTADGRTASVIVAGGTVAEAVAKAGITLGEWDELSVDGQSVVAADLAVTVTRVKLEFYTEKELVPYPTTIERDKTMDSGTEKVAQKGKNGQKEITYCKRYENGELVSTEVSREEITLQPLTQVLIKGTKPVVSRIIEVGGITLELDAKGQPINYKEMHTGSATAYTAPAGAGTSIGMKAQEGVVAVDPDLIPYRSKLYIVSPDGKFVYGYAVAGDTGGAAMRGDIVVDVFYDTYEECAMFGRRNMNVYIIG